MSEFLYGTDIDDEYLGNDADDVVDRRASDVDVEGLPFTGVVYRWTVAPLGEFGCVDVPTAEQILTDIVEAIADECGFEEIADGYSDAAGEPDVIAAFQAARDLLVSKQKFRIADRLDARATYEITAIDENGIATYTIGDWEPA